MRFTGRGAGHTGGGKSKDQKKLSTIESQSGIFKKGSPCWSNSKGKRNGLRAPVTMREKAEAEWPSEKNPWKERRKNINPI